MRLGWLPSPDLFTIICFLPFTLPRMSTISGSRFRIRLSAAPCATTGLGGVGRRRVDERQPARESASSDSSGRVWSPGGWAGLRSRLMRPEVGEVLHFSGRSVDHPIRPSCRSNSLGAQRRMCGQANAAHAPSYWFPRQCPRAMAWARPGTSDADRQRILGPQPRACTWSSTRGCVGFRRRKSSRTGSTAEFEAYGDDLDPHAFVARHPVRSLRPAEPVGDLLPNVSLAYRPATLSCVASGNARVGLLFGAPRSVRGGLIPRLGKCRRRASSSS